MSALRAIQSLKANPTLRSSASSDDTFALSESSLDDTFYGICQSALSLPEEWADEFCRIEPPSKKVRIDVVGTVVVPPSEQGLTGCHEPGMFDSCECIDADFDEIPSKSGVLCKNASAIIGLPAALPSRPRDEVFLPAALPWRPQGSPAGRRGRSSTR